MHYYVPYSRKKIWWGSKFGGLAVYITTAKLKFTKISYSLMAIPYQTGKFKSANILAIASLGSTAKFNSRQYFRLYGTSCNVTYMIGNTIGIIMCMHPYRTEQLVAAYVCVYTILFNCIVITPSRY